MGEAVGRVYVARHFPPEAKGRMDVLIASLVDAYRQSIEALDWMGADTRRGPWTSSGSSRRRSATRFGGGTTPACGLTRRT